MKRIMNIVNFVRGIEPRWEMDLYTPVAEQIKYNKKHSIPNTFLLQYDAMLRADLTQLFQTEQDENMELGVWLENCRDLIETVGLQWRGREGYDWDWYVNVGFLPGYTPAQREKIIDEVFRLFKQRFGRYPQVAGSWLLDAHSMDYMCQKYDMKAFCICREQYAVDAYTLWGGYSNGGYYPSKNNMLCPAQTKENQICAPVFRMLMPDPIHNYDGKKVDDCDVWTLEPAWKCGQDAQVTDWYFDTYYKTPCLTHSHATTGQENSFGWHVFGEGYCMQLDKLAQLQKQGVVSLQKLGDTGDWYRENFPMSAPTAQVAQQDWCDGMKTVWYNCKNYRAGLFWEDGRLRLRDLTKFDDRYQERYLTAPCEGWLATYDNLPLVDSRMWTRADSPCALSLQKEVTDIHCAEQTETVLLVKVSFADGTEGTMMLCEEGITFEGCGDLLYQWGDPGEETGLTIANGKLCGSHNGFAYEVRIDAQLTPCPDGTLLQPKNGKLRLRMDICIT